MKIKGKVIQGPAVEIVAIPRDGGDVIFKCRAVLDYEPFEKLVPEPVPPQQLAAGQTIPAPDFDDKEYIKACGDRAQLQYRWMCIQSILATEGLEFDTIKLNNPTTFDNLQKELTDSGFSPYEITEIVKGIQAANGMSDKRMIEARERFFKSQKDQVIP